MVFVDRNRKPRINMIIFDGKHMNNYTPDYIYIHLISSVIHGLDTSNIVFGKKTSC